MFAMLSPMKRLSSSNIVFTGGIIYSAGALIGYSDTQLATCATGALLAVAAIASFFVV